MSTDNTAISEILRHIDDGDWHDVFSIHERFNLSPSRIFVAIQYLKELCLLEENERRIRLKITDDLTLLSEVRDIFLDDQVEIESLPRYTTPTLLINEFYTPEIRLLDDALKIQSLDN